jgi:hypothetical protein
MTSARTPRWALSFADLCLVLLGFFILLHAQSGDRTRLAQGLRSAFGDTGDVSVRRHELAAAALFQPGEAVLTKAGERRILLLARGAPSARIERSGSGGNRAGGEGGGCAGTGHRGRDPGHGCEAEGAADFYNNRIR